MRLSWRSQPSQLLGGDASPLAKMLKFQNLALIRTGAKHKGFEIFLAEEMLEGGREEVPSYLGPIETVHL